MDVVTSRISEKATEASSYEDLDGDINDIVISKAEQLDSTINWMIGLGGNLPGQELRGLAPRYFPLVVAYNGFRWNQIMAQEIYDRLLSRGLLQHPLINPLSVIDIRELEYIETAAERGVSFGTLLQDVLAAGAIAHPMGWYISRHTGLSWPSSLRQPLDEAAKDLEDSVSEEFRPK
jgi:hypothetical protein